MATETTRGTVPTTEPMMATSPHTAASRSLASLFGLDARAATLTVIVDLMVFGIDTASVETLLPFGVAIAVALGAIVYRIQRHWYRDDKESALIKAMTITLLTCVPVPITPLFAVPSGLLGILRSLRGNKTGEDQS